MLHEYTPTPPNGQSHLSMAPDSWRLGGTLWLGTFETRRRGRMEEWMNAPDDRSSEDADRAIHGPQCFGLPSSLGTSSFVIPPPVFLRGATRPQVAMFTSASICGSTGGCGSL